MSSESVKGLTFPGAWFAAVREPFIKLPTLTRDFCLPFPWEKHDPGNSVYFAYVDNCCIMLLDMETYTVGAEPKKTHQFNVLKRVQARGSLL